MLPTWGPRATALAAFVLFALLAPAGPYGAPPPAGSPLWLWLAEPASWIPIGELGFRLQLLSAVAGALAVLWTARLVLAIGRGSDGAVDDATAWGGITAGALLATSLLFLRAATVSSVDVPTVAVIAAAALLFERVASGGGASAGLGLAVVCGLGLGTHGAFAWIGPVVVALLIVRLYRGAKFPLATPVLVAIVVGGLYASLAVRGGVPLTALLDHAELRVAPAPAADLADSLGPFGVIAALGGLVVLWRRRRTWWIAALLVSVAATAGTPLLWAAAVAAGVGVAALVRLTGRFAWIGGIGVAALCVLPAAVLSIPAFLTW